MTNQQYSVLYVFMNLIENPYYHPIPLCPEQFFHPEDSYGLISYNNVHLVPPDAGIVVAQHRIRPIEVVLPDNGTTEEALVVGCDERNEEVAVCLIDFPGIELFSNDLQDVTSPLITVHHSKRRIPEGFLRILALGGASNETDDIPPTRFGYGELSPGHTGEGFAIYVQAKHVGNCALQGGAVKWLPVAEQAVKNFPFYAFAQVAA